MKKSFKAILFLSLVLIIASCNKEESSGPEGTFTDSRDGKVYKTIKIGNQTWLAENLAYLPVVNRSTEGSATETRYYVYGYQGNDVNEAKATTNYQTYGALYNYKAAVQACPPGWHLPTDEEWKELETFIGINPDLLDGNGGRGEPEGDKLKATSGWENNGNGSNESGFTAIPGGIRAYEGTFNVKGEWAEFWSSTSDGTPNASWNRYLVYENSEVGRWPFDHQYGLSVRCVKD